MIGNSEGCATTTAFERDLYIIRRRIEKQALADNITEFYICSLVLPLDHLQGPVPRRGAGGLLPGPERRALRLLASRVFHQRYSTNTLPSWRLAQPFRVLAHNGEINTLRGNVNWMKSHETRMVAEAFGAFNEDIKPLIQAGSSDSAALDAVFEALVRGRAPAAAGQDPADPARLVAPHGDAAGARDLFTYCNCVMEPWDGPAALVATNSRWVVAGMDRNGLRPMRYSRTRDGLLVVGSETGMVAARRAATSSRRAGSAPASASPSISTTGTLLPRPGAQGLPGRPEALLASGSRTSPISTSVPRSAAVPPDPATSAASCAAGRRSTASPSRTWS